MTTLTYLKPVSLFETEELRDHPRAVWLTPATGGGPALYLHERFTSQTRQGLDWVGLAEKALLPIPAGGHILIPRPGNKAADSQFDNALRVERSKQKHTPRATHRSEWGNMVIEPYDAYMPHGGGFDLVVRCWRVTRPAAVVTPPPKPAGAQLTTDAQRAASDDLDNTLARMLGGNRRKREYPQLDPRIEKLLSNDSSSMK